MADASTVAWSGLIAGLISLAGVWLSNKSSLDRLQLQQKHDREESRIDRKTETRREVYLSGVDFTHALLAHLGKLPDLPVSPQDGDAFQAFLAASSKIRLVAESEAAPFHQGLRTNLPSSTCS